MKAVSIDPKEISVVIQGPLHLDQGPGIYDCIESIKRHLPGAEIIVSTWLSEPALPDVYPTRNRSGKAALHS